jgi:L-aminopeptidase/D-esterase-like protein
VGVDGDLVVAALMVVNAVGEALEPGVDRQVRLPGRRGPLEATTVGIVVTNAKQTKLDCLKSAESGHDGLARALDPIHTASDGDAIVAAATGVVEPRPGAVRALSAWVVEQAVRDALS